jgi:MoaA/NifB/PqqE/SkfB family radical SAM enzyme
MNVSIDGVGDAYARVRGFDGFSRADEAVIALRKVSKHVGINCVVTRENFETLPEIFAYAKKR